MQAVAFKRGDLFFQCSGKKVRLLRSHARARRDPGNTSRARNSAIGWSSVGTTCLVAKSQIDQFLETLESYSTFFDEEREGERTAPTETDLCRNFRRPA